MISNSPIKPQLPRADAKLRLSKPSEAKDVANPFGKSYAQTLRAGLELRPPVIFRRRFGGRLAEYQQYPTRKRTKK
jgi:hypothetical protein